MPLSDPKAPLEPCPHCGGDARLSPHAVFRFACAACGKPRLPLDGREARTDAATAQQLAAAHRSRLAKFLWQFASLGAFSTGFGLGLVGLGLSHWLEFAALGNAVVGLLALVPLVLGVLFWSRAKKAAQASKDGVMKAWQSAVQQLFAQRAGRLTAEDLSRLLGVDLEQATLLLAEAEVSAWIDPADQPRLRVDGSDFDPAGELELEADAAKLGTVNGPTRH